MTTATDTILAIDLGRYKSFACVYHRTTRDDTFRSNRSCLPRHKPSRPMGSRASRGVCQEFALDEAQTQRTEPSMRSGRYFVNRNLMGGTKYRTVET